MGGLVDTIKKMGITLKERKKRIIQAIAEHDDWIEDIETVLESLAEKDSHERTEQTWNKYAQPLKDKTDLDEIINSQPYDSEGFKQCVGKFFEDIPEGRLLKMHVK